MFRYTSSIDGKKQEFSNRDALLLGLESEENRCLQMNISTQLTLEQVDQDGNVLDQAQLIFPMEEGKSYQEALEEFGLVQELRKGFLASLIPSKNMPAAHQKPAGHQEKEVAPLLRRSASLLGKLFKGLVLGLALLLGLVSFLISTQNTKQVKTLKSQSAHPKLTQTNTAKTSDEHAVDVFSRYFLATYFNQRDGLKNFVASDIEIDQLKTDVKTANSVLLEQIKQTKGTYTMTYVCGLKGKDGKVSTKRVTFTLKQNKSSDYGYQVITAPKFNAYPN
ncbi:TPA: hypothetical protein ACQUIK_000607 [Streptococcus mutans]